MSGLAIVPPAENPDQIDLDTFKKLVPKACKTMVTQENVDLINSVLDSSDIREEYRENLIGYTQVLTDPRFTIPNYLNAVRYVSYKLLGGTNEQAYIKTFPDRYSKFLANGTCAKDIASYVSSYNKNKLVNLVWEQTIIPTHVFNQDVHQKAVNVLADLMITANSEKVRSDSASALLTHLKAPENLKVEVDIGFKDDSSITALRETTKELTAVHREMLEQGTATPLQIAHSKIKEKSPVDGEFTEVAKP